MGRRARCVPSSCLSFSFPFIYLPYGSFVMSLDNSDNLDISDAGPLDPALEATTLPKFDMHLYKSSLNETQVKWLIKCYKILEELHPRVMPEGVTMDALPNNAIKLYVHHFQQGGLRVPFFAFFLKVVEYFCVHISQLVPISINHTTIFEMYCRALNVTPTVPLFRVFYKLYKQGNWFSFQSRVGKGCKPCFKDAPTSLKKWKDKFFLVDWRVAPIAIPWRHHDSSVADPLPKSREFNESDVERLREVVITLHKPSPSLLYADGLSYSWKHARHVSILKDLKEKDNTLIFVIYLLCLFDYCFTFLIVYVCFLFLAVITVAEFLRLPNFRGCKVTASTLLPPGTARRCCKKVLAIKEKKRKKTKAKAAVKADDHDQVEKVVRKRRAGEEETSRSKKRKTRLGTPSVHLDSKHVSSPIPFNHSRPLETLANEAHVSENASTARLKALRN
ncbi:hypothetical protein Tco_0656475 [Tanacetum coccineum]|uniref:Transposase (putative) gypsy type domain-containing protein n=1 Tax=Tanacetum coccineum TaxID=301880 RepID=A0ABQ4X8W1_9ASTR